MELLINYFHALVSSGTQIRGFTPNLNAKQHPIVLGLDHEGRGQAETSPLVGLANWWFLARPYPVNQTKDKYVESQRLQGMELRLLGRWLVKWKLN